MSFYFVDDHGDPLDVRPTRRYDGSSAISLYARQGHESTNIIVPLDRVEEVIAGIRDTARQAAVEQPATVPAQHGEG